jgi:hypothetical protein
MRIAILGWGSLLWEDGGEFDDWHDSWRSDGPNLKIEFCRVSDSRLGALTLVVDSDLGSPMTVEWCLSKRRALEDAVGDLRCREKTVVGSIGRIQIDKEATAVASTGTEASILSWAREQKLDAVVWTALKSNFEEEVKAPFSVDAVVAYLKTLAPAAKVKAAEYVWRAPEFVQTPVRSALQAEPWFSRSGS